MEPPRVIITGGSGFLAKSLQAEMSSAGMQVLAPGKEELDVCCAESVTRYFKSVGDVDLLICNAGVTEDKPLARMSESDWDDVVSVNLKGSFLCSRELIRGMMRKRQGHIVFISSFSAEHPPVGQANYAAAKAGLLGLMKSLASECGSRNIRMNAVFPGFMETKMTSSLSSEVKKKVLARHALGRYNTAQDTAKFITFLHQHMPHTSGQVFNLDSRII